MEVSKPPSREGDGLKARGLTGYVASEAGTGSTSAGKKPRCLLVSRRPRWRQGTSSRA